MAYHIIQRLQLGFCFLYLLSVWVLVFLMAVKEHKAPKDRSTARWILLAFTCLALGDTPHIGLKLLGSALGNLQYPIKILWIKTDFDAFGALATECTFTLFYLCMLFAWQTRFQQHTKLPVLLMMGVALARCLIMMHPDNLYSTLKVREPWFTLRGIPFVLLQTGVAFLMLREALKNKDKPFIAIGILMFFAAACFATVLFFGTKYPALQMFMFPKTMAYLLIGFIAYWYLYKKTTKIITQMIISK
jgi:hypothetical protein